jgi:hypothetical protein
MESGARTRRKREEAGWKQGERNREWIVAEGEPGEGKE